MLPRPPQLATDLFRLKGYLMLMWARGAGSCLRDLQLDGLLWGLGWERNARLQRLPEDVTERFGFEDHVFNGLQLLPDGTPLAVHRHYGIALT